MFIWSCHIWRLLQYDVVDIYEKLMYNPADIDLFKVNYRNTRKSC